MSLSPKTIQIIKATSPVIADKGYAITSCMYKHMLSGNAQVRELFNPTHQVVLPGDKVANQPHALAASVAAYAANIDSTSRCVYLPVADTRQTAAHTNALFQFQIDLGALSGAIENIAQKHVSLHILPEHYPIVGANLLNAIKETLGDAATPEIMDAWEEGYGFLADVLIKRELELRETLAQAPGGWTGWRPFIVSKKVQESSEIISFHLKPQDGQPIVSYEPGQYVGLRFETDEFTTQRNYSLSSAPGHDEYRITVKKHGPIASGCPMGKVSSFLHDKVTEGDVLRMSVPCGDFTLKLDHDKPIVLISGGVGITPLASMLEYMVEKKVTNRIEMINACRSPETQALRESFEQFARENDNLALHTLYSERTDGCPYGRLSESYLESVLASKDAHFYFCGPPSFMRSVNNILGGWGVPKDQIHFEFFGPME